MARSGKQITGSYKSTKTGRLATVFSKAIDVSADSFTESELNHCFNDLTPALSNAVWGSLVKVLGRSRNMMELRFNDLCEQWNIDELLTRLDEEVFPNGSKGEDSRDGIVESTIHAIRCREKDDLSAAISRMETDINTLSRKSSLVKSQIQEQIAALSMEQDRLAVAVAQYK